MCPFVQIDPDELENYEFLMDNVPCIKSDPDGHLSVEADLDELEDHELILHNAILASIGMQKERSLVSDASHPR